MVNQDFIDSFREKLRILAKEEKYSRSFTPKDEERACQAFAMALENPSISETLLFELLIGEKV